MCGPKVSNRERIEVQTAGVGTNKGNQQDISPQFSRSDWMLLGLIGIIVLVMVYFIIKKWKRSMRRTIVKEIEMHELRKSRSTMINNTE